MLRGDPRSEVRLLAQAKAANLLMAGGIAREASIVELKFSRTIPWHLPAWQFHWL